MVNQKAGRIGLAGFVRMPRIHKMPLNQIKQDDDRAYDEHFVKLYQNYLQGKLVGMSTRVDIHKIVPGVIRRAATGRIEQVEHEADPRHVAMFARDFRRGFRSTLILYRGFLGNTAGQFVCADDVTAFHAYGLLGIRRVPAMILGKQIKMLQESAICTRALQDRPEIVFDSTVPIKATAYQTTLGNEDELLSYEPVTAIRKLSHEIELAIERINSFHLMLHSEDKIYYHETLHSVAHRMTETLRSIELLLMNDLGYQILPLVRSLYELFLTFYIDWLAPEKVGPLLHALAVLRRSPRSSKTYRDLKTVIDHRYRGLANICENATAKGGLSPLGSDFHKAIYSSLSPIVHQDLGVAYEYGGMLESSSPLKLKRRQICIIVRWLDLIVTATVSRLLDDVGGPG
jgi:hypothetical protein